MEVQEATNLPDVSRTALTEQGDFGQGDILDMQRSGPLTLQGETNIAGTITRNENIYNDNRTINTNKTNVGSVIIQANFSNARDLGDTTRKAVAVGGEGPRQRNRGRGNVGKRKRKQAKAPYNYKTAAQKRGRPPPDIPGAPRLILEWMFENKGKAALLIMVLLVVTVSSILVIPGSFNSGTSKHDDGRDISGSSSNTPRQMFRQPDRATSRDEMQSTIHSSTYTSSFPLHSALVIVYHLIYDEAADINQKDNAGNTPLHIAASMGSQRLVNTLIKKGAKVNAGNKLGGYPLHEACRNGHLAVVQILCEEGADVNVEDRQGASPLTEAMSQRFDTIFDYLLDRGSNIDAVDANTLVKSGKLLRGASRSSSGSTPVNTAAQLNSVYYVAKLLKQGAKTNVPDSRGWEPLHTAAFHGNSANVLQLLKNNASVDALTKDNNATALCLASQEGHLDVVVILLSHGAHVNHTQDDGASALFLAAQSGHADVVDTLLKHGTNINVTLRGEASTPLFMAVQEGHAKVVNKILDHDKMKRRSASSAMCLAAFSGHLSVVKALLDQGARVDAKNATANRTPLVYACQEGHLSVVRYLLDHGADISGKGKFTPLAMATYKEKGRPWGLIAWWVAGIGCSVGLFWSVSVLGAGVKVVRGWGLGGLIACLVSGIGFLIVSQLWLVWAIFVFVIVVVF